MPDFLNPIAEKNNPDSGEIISPEEAYLIRKSHKFYCPDYNCRDDERVLITKKSFYGNYFFSHKPGCGHPIMPETLLHKSAVRWFMNKTKFEVPLRENINNSIQILDKEKTVLEFRQLESHIPDVKLTTNNNFEFAIEIVVTNDISEAKKKIISKFGLPSLRLDLSDFYQANKLDCQTNITFIQSNLESLMTDISRKSWVSILPLTKLKEIDINDPIISDNNFQVNEEKVIEQTSQSNEGWVIASLLSILLLLGLPLIRGTNRKRRFIKIKKR